MKHFECANYLSLDCEKGMCAVAKMVVPMDGEGSESCPNFKPGALCQHCENFKDPDKYGIGTCVGFGKPDWAYAQCGGFCCEHYQQK